MLPITHFTLPKVPTVFKAIQKWCHCKLKQNLTSIVCYVISDFERKTRVCFSVKLMRCKMGGIKLFFFFQYHMVMCFLYMVHHLYP